MKKTRKGQAGYYAHEKVRRGIITAIMFAIPLTIYFTAWKISGTNRNLMTIVAIVGIIPAAKFCVDWIMVLMQKEAPAQIVEITEKYAGSLVHGYDLTVTAYEGRMPLDAAVICGSEVVCISTRGKKEQFAFMENHIKKILADNRISSENVKIFDNEKQYSERIRTLALNPQVYRDGLAFSPDSRYPDLSREEVICHLLFSISI